MGEIELGTGLDADWIGRSNCGLESKLFSPCDWVDFTLILFLIRVV